MAIQVASTLTPKSGKSYYLVEDIYVKGGLQIKPDIAARDAIPLSNLKVGSLVLCLDSGKIWQVDTLVVPTIEQPNVVPAVTWTELHIGGGGGGAGSLGELSDVDLTTEPTTGQALIFDGTSQTWKPSDVTGGAAGIRSVVIHDIPALPATSSVEFELSLGYSAIVLMLKVSRPVKVTAYSTPTKDEPNPYTFLATEDHLVDDGTSLLSDGTVLRSRQYSIFVNMEAPKVPKTYVTVESVDAVDGPVTLEIIYLPLEI